VKEKQKLLRQIPSVDEILKQNLILQNFPRHLAVNTIREVLEIYRKGILDNKINKVDYKKIIFEIIKRLKIKQKNHLKKVINATGVVIHTNLGRSLLAEEAISHLIEVARYYNNLEYDLKIGKRGSRYVHVEELLCELTGAEAAMVVNNNAAAVFLILNTLAYGKKVIVSRGELVEIGGSFRMPDVMRKSGVKLVEVGTTNRTHLYDYEQAIDEETALLMKVHKSNFKIIGFTKEVSLTELVNLGEKYNLPVIEDLGSGNFINLTKYGIGKEPTVQETLATGVSVVSFSGDKLLGGPQAGIILGKRSYLEAIKKNPLNRALRIDKFTLAALESTLKLYRDEEKAIREIPTLYLLTISQKELKRKAMKLKRAIKKYISEEEIFLTIKSSISQAGGGSLPGEVLPTYVVALRPKNISVSQLEEKLRQIDPPIIARIEEDMLYLDVRTILDEEIKIIPHLIKTALEENYGKGT